MKTVYLAALLAVAACTQMPTPANNASEAAPAAPSAVAPDLLDDKALWTAEALYNVPAQAYTAANSRGVLPASVKAVAKPKLVRLYAMLKVARAAHAANDSKGFYEAFGNMQRLKSEVDVVLAFYTN